MRGFNKDSKNIFYDKNNTEIHNNLNFNYSKDCYERISLLINNCDETKFSTNNLEEYIYNYFEKKKEKDLKEKREFKNRKEKFKKSNNKRKLFTGGNNDFNQITDVHKKNLSLNRISSAINNRNKLTLFKDKYIQKDRKQYLVSAKTKLTFKTIAKNKRSQTKFRDTYSSNMDFSPELSKKTNDFQKSKIKIKKPSIKSIEIAKNQHTNENNNFLKKPTKSLFNISKSLSKSLRQNDETINEWENDLNFKTKISKDLEIFKNSCRVNTLEENINGKINNNNNNK
jgi:hypothetical protein